jgi:rhodanese-related sulfurtransferase
LVDSKKGKAKGLNFNEGAGLVGKVVNIASMIEARDGTGGLQMNTDFIPDVQAEFPNPSAVTLLVICRSGGRAEVAALALAGLNYTTYNIADGFQGPSNNADDPGRDTGYRDVAGWVNDGLPWNQSRSGGYYVNYTP